MCFQDRWGLEDICEMGIFNTFEGQIRGLSVNTTPLLLSSWQSHAALKKTVRWYCAATPIQLALHLHYWACSLVSDDAWHKFKPNTINKSRTDHFILFESFNWFSYFSGKFFDSLDKRNVFAILQDLDFHDLSLGYSMVFVFLIYPQYSKSQVQAPLTHPMSYYMPYLIIFV